MPNQNFGIPTAHTFLDDIQPGLQQLAYSLPRLINPHYDQQIMLKEQLAKDPAMAQKLIDMGPDQVAKIYGKKALNLYDSTGAKSSKQSTEELLRKALTDAGKDPQFVNEYIANLTGTQTAKGRVKEDLGIKRDEKGLVIADQTIEGNKGQLSDAARTRQQEIDGLATGEIVAHTRPEAMRDLYKAKNSGLITADEWNKMSSIKKYREDFETSHQDFWAKKRNEIDLAHLAISRQAADPNKQTSQYLQNRVAAVAADIGEEHGIIPTDIIPLLQSRTLYDSALKDEKNPMHIAAKAIENRRERAGEKDYRTAMKMVEGMTSGFRMTATSKDPRITDDMRQAAVDNINAINRAQLIEFTKDVPVYSYDAGKSGRKFFGMVEGDKRFYLNEGKDMANTTPKAGAKATTDSTTNNDAEWKAASPEERKAGLLAIPDTAERNKARALLTRLKLEVAK